MNIGSGDVYGPFSGLKEAPPPFTAVIILTYMRSGSSLTGDILQQSPGAFYVYEPLRLLERLVKLQPGAPLRFVNGTIRFFYGSFFRLQFDSLWVNYIGNFRFVASTGVTCSVNKWCPGISDNCERLSVFFCFNLVYFEYKDHFVKISGI